jgi:GalNAc5-diNAcBac-PP-undecaprenol beta-1,3-glucosyltransferase
MKPELAATVLVPTSIDRGPLLRYSIGSILRQSVDALEVFIVGDGASDETRDAARDLERADRRVRFFDRPKGARRGELHRHAALQEARGRIVCYLCDRDLYFPDHVAEMARLLERTDFAHPPVVYAKEQGYDFFTSHDLAVAAGREAMIAANHGISLSFIAHTRAAYARLDQGWTTTPDGHFTDIYFSRRFVCDPRMRLASGTRPTALSFHRGSHPGWSTARRLPELAAWSARLEDAAGREALRAEILAAAARMAATAGDRGLAGGLDRLVLALAKRPGLPFYHVMRRTWRRLRYGPNPD